MIETIVTLIMAYIGTNIDDMFVNMLFFAQAESRHAMWSVTAGRYIGVGIVVLICFLGAGMLHSVPENYIRFLGVIPVILGIREWIRYRKGDEPEDEARENRAELSGILLWKVILITLSDGADNIGVYLPLFAGYTLFQMAAVVLVFSVMTALECILEKKLSDLPILKDFLLKYKPVVVPVVFILVGIYILWK
ncbi:MAG: cadmium resistance transporter [Otoolea sp.]